MIYGLKGRKFGESILLVIKALKEYKKSDKWPKMMYPRGRAIEKLAWFPLMGYPNTLKSTKYQQIFEFHALKQRNCIIVIPDFSKISACLKRRLYEGVQ